MNHRAPHSAFTLIELLVVIAIIAILSIVVIFTLQPSQLLAQSRDSTRLSDLGILNTALGDYTADQGGANNFSLGSSSITYVSIPDPLATSSLGDQCNGLGLPALPASDTYFCAASSTYRRVDGTGWIPINFNKMSGGAPISQLPVDSANQSSTGLYYTYTTNGTQYEVTALFESQKYKSQYGSAPQDPGYPEVAAEGSSLALSELWNPSGLVGWWPFSEGSGSSTADASGNGNSGAWNGTPIGTNGIYYTGGKVGTYAGNFDGSADYVDAGSSTLLNLQSFNFSFAAWVYTTLSSQNGVVMGKTTLGSAGANDYDMDIIGSHYDVRISPSAGVETVAGPLVSVGQWVHIVGVRTVGSSFAIYINGSFYGSMADNAGSVSNTYDFRIGRASNNLWSFSGLIDDARIYNRALSAAEVAALYNAEK